MKKRYNIEYHNRYGIILIKTIKARNELDAEKKFYKQDMYSLIRSISLIDK